jgi:hypothetical protein
MNIDYLELYDLRKNTRLNIIDKLKIMRMRAKEEKRRNLINKLEHCNIGVDFREADLFEYEKRKAILSRKKRF